MSLGVCVCFSRFQLLPSQPSCLAGPSRPHHLTALPDESCTYSSGSDVNTALGLVVLLWDPMLLSLLLAPASLLHPPGHKPLCLFTPETWTKHMHSLLGDFMDPPQSRDPVIPPHHHTVSQMSSLGTRFKICKGGAHLFHESGSESISSVVALEISD